MKKSHLPSITVRKLVPGRRYRGVRHYFRVLRNPSRTNIKRGDRFLQADSALQ
jgi:hypothetical protein